jgi:DNA-binding beta-propeller fold protein YncE
VIVGRTTTPMGSFGVAVSSTGIVFVSVTGGSVIRGDLTTRTFPTTITLAAGLPLEVLFTRDERLVLVGHQNSNQGPITLINVANNSVLSTIPTPGGVVSSAQNDAGTRYFFGLVNTAQVLELEDRRDAGFSARTIAIDAGFSLGAMNGLGFDDARQTIYGTHTSGTLFTVPLSGGASVQSVVGGDVRGAAFDRWRDRFYAANELGTGFVRTSPALSPVPGAPGLPAAWGAALTPDGRELWLTNSLAGTLSIVDLDAPSQMPRVLTGLGRPRKIAFDPSGRNAVIANENGEVLFFQ